ncbi:unnamed protein product, partial [Mesorhabditis belari]|uniref:Uncharacterized protein n=1 Tax=Mesorhabditis belari TaxID=2138241 RepID=A0AAF3FMZ2_9BILA
MLKQLLVAFALFSVALTINCYYDWSSGKGESHTGNKMNRPCPGCDYCLKFKTKEKSNTAVYWDCGCSQYNGISGADCLRSGSQKETVYIDEAHTNISNSINCDGCDFCLKTIVKDKNVHNVNWGCGCENRNLMGYACTEPGKENDQSHNANGEKNQLHVRRIVDFALNGRASMTIMQQWLGIVDVDSGWSIVIKKAKERRKCKTKSNKTCSCSFCFKGTGKVDDKDYTVWGCGCDNGFIDCKTN